MIDQNTASVQRTQIIGILIALLGAILFSTKAVLVKLAYQYDIDAITLLLFRMVFALPIYIGILIFYKKKVTYQPSRKDYRLLLLIGLSGFYAASFLDFSGLKYITASLERLILFTYPTIVVMIVTIFFKEKLTRPKFYALLFTYIGIGIVFIGNVDVANQENLVIGSILIFLCAISYAIYIVGSGILLPKFGTWIYTSIAMIVAATAVIIHYLFIHKGIGNLHFPYQVYIISIIMATFSTVIPTLLTSEGIRLIGASNSAIVASVGPVSTITLAYIFLDERLTTVQILGGLLVLGGVLFITLQRKKR